MRKSLQVALIFLCGVSFAQDTPYYLRDTKSNQDLGALNQDLRDLSMRPGSKLTQTVTPTSCPSGQTLAGATFQNGQTWGGSCQSFGVLSGTQTWTGTNTFTGTVTGTISSLAASTFTKEGLWSTSWTNTTFSGDNCVSTVTITSYGNKIAVSFNGSVQSSGSGNVVVLNVLQDGSYVGPYTTTIGMNSCQTYTSNAPCPISFRVIISAPAAGSHSYCLSRRINANTGNFDTTFSTPQFGAEEIK